MHNFHHGDAVAWAKNYQGDPFHALFCDAPYEIGFMSKGWDASGIAFDPETWKAFARVLHPGAFLFVFAGTLNDDLISVAMRQSGLRKHHKMLSWNYGSGFPKATRIDTAIDKKAGAERKVVKHRSGARNGNGKNIDYGSFASAGGQFAETAPATELAQTWQGHRYGQQALKPALEPILIFQKPYDNAPIDSITATGAGALNIDGARIPGAKPNTTRGAGGQNGRYGPIGAQGRITDDGLGRWPANLLLSHSPACNGVCVLDCPIERLGEQSGEGKSIVRLSEDRDQQASTWSLGRSGITPQVRADTGTSARYFFQADYVAERLEYENALAYFAKASSSEREAGLDPLQTRIMRDFYGLDDFDETTVDDGREKSIDNPYQRGETLRRNTHPTLKPIALTRYLSTLLLPPDAYAPRRLFIPFAGAASEMIGAMLAGWEHIEGVELDETHCRIAAARLAYWDQLKHKFNRGQPIKVKSSSERPDQMLLF